MSTFSTKPPSKSVFVGNIPYGLTEEQIIDIFSSAGKVLNFRLVYDRETGRPKGFGFAEYPDSDSASSAVRNLNDYEIMNRKLRVDFSNDGAEDDSGNPITNPQLNTFTQLPALINGVPVPPPGYMAPQVAQPDVVLPPLPQGVDPPEGLTCTNAISRTLGTLPPQQLLEVLSQMKSLVTNDPATATALLKQAPQLSYAIFQALLLMNLVSTDTLTEVVDHAPAPPPAAAPALAPAGLPIHAPPPQQYQQPPYGQPQGYPPHPRASAPSGYAPTPPQAGYGAPPQAAAPPTAAAGGQDMDVLVQQVLAMPQELIDSLAPAERAQIMALRAQFGGGR